MMKIPTNWIYIQNAYDEKNIFALQNELNSISSEQPRPKGEGFSCHGQDLQD